MVMLCSCTKSGTNSTSTLPINDPHQEDIQPNTTANTTADTTAEATTEATIEIAAADESIAGQLKKAEVGDTVTFGEYVFPDKSRKETIQWVVLEKENGKAFLITKNSVANRQFNNAEYQTAYVDKTWEYSDIRRWLNDDFYEEAFSDEEKQCIAVSNITNFCYSGEAEDGRNTNDRIFLLSVGEAEAYRHLKCVGMFTGPKCWLRSPGIDKYAPSNMDYDDRIDYDGTLSSYKMDIYPCAWVTYLDEDEIGSTEADGNTPPEQGRVIKTGTSGEVVWEFDDKGIMTISGSGAMEDYLHYLGVNVKPWADFSYQINTVVIKDGVTYVGDESFLGCENLKEVYIAGSVTEIGNSCFISCYSLEKVVISEGVKKIGSYAFKNCTSLETVEIPDGVTTIDVYAFGRCRLLKTVIIPSSAASMTYSIFDGCDSLETVNGIEAETWKAANLQP